MAYFEILGGSSGLALADVAHVMVPGRGRDMSGFGLSSFSLARVVFAANLYNELALQQKGGVIICCGYKTPSDKRREAWSPAEDPSKVFVGKPEAYSMRDKLVELGIPSSVIKVEADSIDTVTNFAHAEGDGYFPDDRPVAIVAQQQHLNRIIRLVAPKTLRRQYIGVVVPEAESIDTDSLKAKLTTKTILLGVKPEMPGIAGKAHVRAKIAIKVMNPVVPLVRKKPYKTDSASSVDSQ